MFIEIINPSNPLRTENFLRPYKRGEKTFTPEVARQVLETTNHKKSISDTLQLIANLPKDQQADFKDIILATFDHREQPADTLLLAKKLATSHGFEDELNAILNYDYTKDTEQDVVYASAINQIAVYVTYAAIPKASDYPPNTSLVCINNSIHLSNTELASLKSIKFRQGAEVYLKYCKSLPQILDFSGGCVNLNDADLTNLKKIICRNGVDICFKNADIFPQELDFSQCKSVYFDYCDLISSPRLIAPKNGILHLNNSNNISADIYFSTCRLVGLRDSHFQDGERITFGKGSHVFLNNARNLPKIVDVSQCAVVECENADFFSRTETIIFSSAQQMQQSKINTDNVILRNKIIFKDPPPVSDRCIAEKQPDTVRNHTAPKSDFISKIKNLFNKNR